MATTPDEQSGGCGHSTASNRSNPFIPDESNSQACTEPQITLVGTWDTVSAKAEAYDTRNKATVALLIPGVPLGETQLSGYLGGLLEFWKPSDRSSQVKLTVFLSDAYNSPRKRQRVDVEDDNCQSPVHHLQENEPTNDIQETGPKPCGNCGGDDHKAAFCDKIGKSGWMEACCKCDSLQHTYEYCPRRRQEEDFEYLILNRGNKGPVKCSLHLGWVVLRELGRAGSPYRDNDVIALPYSSTFSMQWVRNDGRFVRGARRDEAGINLIEPARMNQPLGRAASILGDQRWTIEDDEIDHAESPCKLCLSPDHSEYQCYALCGLCGSDNHQTWLCEYIDKACFCSKYPFHTREECNEYC